MNKIIISGNLTKDIEVKKSTQNKSYISFTLGVREYTGKDNKQANFIDFKAFNATADALAKYCHKGSYVVIIGSLRKSSYVKDGITRYYTEVYVDDFELTPKAKTKTSENPVNAIVEPTQGEQVPLDSDLTDEDLPF